MSGRGVAALGTNQKIDPVIIPPPGPPFDLDSAENGTSVDPASRRIVLGQNQGEAGNPGGLLSDREIPMQGRRLLFTDSTFGNVLFQLFGNSFDGASDSGVAVTVNNNITGNVAAIFSDSANNVSGVNFNTNRISAFLTGGLKICDSGSLTPFVDPGAQVLEIEFADVLITGRLRNQRFVSVHAASPVAVSATADNNKVFTNTGAAGAITFNLPAAVAGLTYTFYVQNANNLIIDAAAGDTIRILALVSAAGGNVSSVTVGSAVTLVAINSTEWVAISALGTWL